MSQLRRNPFTGEWTVCAKNRKERPYDFIHHTAPKTDSAKTCPFCCGHEEWTTQATYQDGENEEWQIRVFPNKYTALSPCEEKEEDIDSFNEQQSANGWREVLVDTPYVWYTHRTPPATPSD